MVFARDVTQQKEVLRAHVVVARTRQRRVGNEEPLYCLEQLDYTEEGQQTAHHEMNVVVGILGFYAAWRRLR